MNIRRRIFIALARVASRHPIWILLGALLLAVGSLVLAASELEIETSRGALISEERPYSRQYREYREAFAKWDDLVVAARAPDEATAERFVDELGAALAKDHQHVRRVLYRIESDALEAKGLLFLSMDELRSLENDLERNRDMLKSLARDPGINALYSAINQEMAEAMVGQMLGGLFGKVEGEEEEGEDRVDLTLLDALTVGLLQALEGREYAGSPWSAFFETPKRQHYMTSEEGDLYFLFIEPVKKPKDPGFSTDVLRSIRREVAALAARNPGVEAGVTGLAALSIDETITSRQDTMVATLIAAVGVFVMFLVFFRQVLRPFLAVVSLLVAIAWTLGFTTVGIGRLTVLSVAFTAILIGLGIDFGIHVLLRYEEEWRGDRSTEANLARTLERVGPGVAAGALTTALAFYAVVLTDFRGLAEIGVIAGTGVLLSLLSALTVLPALLTLAGRRGGGGPHRRPGSDAIGWLLARLDRRPWWVLGLYGVVTLVLGLCAFQVRLDRNLLDLQAASVESVRWERRIMEVAGQSNWYAVSLAPSLDEVSRRTRLFEALPAVKKVESIASVIPKNQTEKLRFLESMVPLLAGIPVEERRPEPVDVEALGRTLASMRFKLSERALERWAPDKLPKREQIVRTRRALVAAIDQLERLSPAEAKKRLATFSEHLFASFYSDLSFLKSHLQPGYVDLADVPDSIQSRYVGSSGRYLIKVFARENIWKYEPMKRFLSQVRRVDPDVTGSPVQTYEAGREMISGYGEGGLYALAVILLYLLIELRSARLAGLAVLPLVGGAVWTVGWMGILRLELNLANLVLLPLLIGIGVDSGIHLVARYAEGKERGFGLIATNTGLAVVASGLTTGVGFASLLVARHHGIWSIGAVLSIGITCVLLAAVIALPALARRRRPNAPRGKRRGHPARPTPDEDGSGG